MVSAESRSVRTASVSRIGKDINFVFKRVVFFSVEMFSITNRKHVFPVFLSSISINLPVFYLECRFSIG